MTNVWFFRFRLFIQSVFILILLVIFYSEITGSLRIWLLIFGLIVLVFQFWGIRQFLKGIAAAKILTETIIDLDKQLLNLKNEQSIILDTMDEVVVYYDLDFNVIWSSKSANDSGLDHNSRHKSGCCHGWNEHHPACETCVIKKTIQQHEVVENEFIANNGRTWSVRTYPVLNSQDILYGILEFSFDISRLKEAEGIIFQNQKELESQVNMRTMELEEVNLKLLKQIDDRKNMESALFQNEYKFRSVIRNSPDGILLTDETGVILEWNDSLSSISGLHRNDVLGRYFMDVQCELVSNKSGLEDNFQINQAAFNEILHKGSSENFNHTLLREIILFNKQFGERIVHVKIFTIPTKNGHKVAGIYRDVTDEKQNELKIISSGRKLKTIFDNTFQSFILLDVEGRILEFNKVSLEIAIQLFQKDLVVGNKLEDYLDDFTRPLFRNLFIEALNGIVVRNEYEFTFNFNQRRWYEVHLAAVYSVDKNIEGVFFNTFDIHARKTASIQKSKMLEKEMELNILKSQFVSSVSHEFRTPLSSIYSNAQLLHRYHDKWDEAKRNKTFSRIYESIKHLTAMLQDVSLLGKGQNGLQRYEPVLSSIVHLCYHVIEECQINMDAVDRIEFIQDIEQCDVMLDTNLVRHILVNILNNSLKYSPKDSKVKFILKRENNNLVFSIQDCGIGIPESDQKNIFQSFFRASNVGGIVGTGLGMAIVKQCVEIHNGEITVESNVGLGTLVVVRIPFKRSDVDFLTHIQ